MTNTNLQTFICAITENGAKHYLALGSTKLQRQDLESFFTDAPTPAISKALDGMKPALFAWVELEQIAERRFSAHSWCFSAEGVRCMDECQLSGRPIRIGELADIITDEIRRV